MTEMLKLTRPTNTHTGLASTIRGHCDAFSSYPSHKLTWNNCIQLIVDSLRSLEIECMLSSISHTCDDKLTQSVCEKLEHEMQRVKMVLDTNESLYQVCQVLLHTDTSLTRPQQSFLIGLLEDFKQSSNPTATNILWDKLRSSIRQFETNLLSASDEIVVPPALVPHLPEEFISDGRIRLSQEVNEYLLYDHDNEDVLQWADAIIDSVGWEENRDLLVDILKLKHQISINEGYRSYGCYIHNNTSIKSPSNVNWLLNSIQQRLQPTVDAELAVLNCQYRWQVVPKADEWMHKHHTFNEHYYFEFDHTATKILETFGSILNLTFEPIPVELPNITSDQLRGFIVDRDGKGIGIIILDPFDRPSKSGDAIWAQTIAHGHGDEVPVCYITCNFRDDDDGPSLLSYEQVRCLFHEIGHLIPSLLTDYPYSDLNGDWVHPDLIELSSTLFETLSDHPLVLRSISRHISTGHQMSINQIRTLIDTHYAFEATDVRTHLRDAIIDHELHNKVHVNTTYDTIQNIVKRIDLSLFQHSTEYTYHDFCNNTHSISTDYAGILYTYLWCKVLAYQALDRVDALHQYNPDGFRRLIPLLTAGRYEDFWSVWHRLELGTPSVHTFCDTISQRSVVNASNSK